MTNAQAFFENLVNVENKVLGVSLKPFCILHYLWLQHIESPLVITTKEVTKADLELTLSTFKATACTVLSNRNIYSGQALAKVCQKSWQEVPVLTRF